MLWRAISFGAVFILNILFARNFAAATSGSVFYLFTVFTFIIQVAGFSLESGVGYYAAKNDISDKELIGFSFLWSVLSTAAVCVFIRLFFKESFPWVFAFCFIAGNMLIAFGNAFCYSRFRFIFPSLIAIAVNIALIGILLANEYAHVNADAHVFIPIYFYSFLVHGLILFIIIAITFRVFPLSFSISHESIRKIFSYSLYAFFANCIFLLVSRVDYFFVKRYCSAEDLGNYIQVSKIAQLFFLLPGMVAAVLFPVIASGGEQDAIRRTKILSVGLTILYLAPCFVLAITGSWLFPWVYGKSFSNMYIPFLLLIPGILFLSSLFPYTAYFAATNRIIVNILGSLFSLGLIVVLDALFIPRYGIRAAALVSSIGYFAYQLYVLQVFRKQSTVSLKSLFVLNKEEWLYIKSRFIPGKKSSS